MPALVMTKARSFNRAPHCAQYSTSILKLRKRSSRHGRYPERWVGEQDRRRNPGRLDPVYALQDFTILRFHGQQYWSTKVRVADRECTRRAPDRA